MFCSVIRRWAGTGTAVTGREGRGANRSGDAVALDTRARNKLLEKSVAPQLDYRCSRWPPQRTISLELEALQRRMVATILRIPQIPGETAADYVKRRGHVAGRHCRQTGMWSSRWFKRAQDWNAHLERPRNRHSWPARLIHYMDSEWLIQRRLLFLPANSENRSCLAGRTDTRAMRGCVNMRWHDEIAYCKR